MDIAVALVVSVAVVASVTDAIIFSAPPPSIITSPSFNSVVKFVPKPVTLVPLIVTEPNKILSESKCKSAVNVSLVDSFGSCEIPLALSIL